MELAASRSLTTNSVVRCEPLAFSGRTGFLVMGLTMCHATDLARPHLDALRRLSDVCLDPDDHVADDHVAYGALLTAKDTIVAACESVARVLAVAVVCTRLGVELGMLRSRQHDIRRLSTRYFPEGHGLEGHAFCDREYIEKRLLYNLPWTTDHLAYNGVDRHRLVPGVLFPPWPASPLTTYPKLPRKRPPSDPRVDTKEDPPSLPLEEDSAL